ncbi:MAG: hypothetical protein ACREDR_00545 [Blastocatellia bacterium]
MLCLVAGVAGIEFARYLAGALGLNYDPAILALAKEPKLEGRREFLSELKRLCKPRVIGGSSGLLE